MDIIKEKHFANGSVYALKTQDDYKIETTDTFLPFYTKDCKFRDNKTLDGNYGSRKERWMIGVSCMSGCPVGCKFCATGKLKKYRNLTADEILSQIEYILSKNSNYVFTDAKESKINYTRMGEPFLNIESVKRAIEYFDIRGLHNIHHYISTIGIKGSDFSWMRGNVSLQISLHSLDEKRRDELIPFKNKMSIKELGEIRTESNLKTTVNLTLVDNKDFDINRLKEYFDPEYFFIKLSPINKNEISESNKLGGGIIHAENY